MMKASFAVMEQLEHDLMIVLGTAKLEMLKVGLLDITDILDTSTIKKQQ